MDALTGCCGNKSLLDGLPKLILIRNTRFLHRNSNLHPNTGSAAGLSGKVHNELLKALCNGLPAVISERLLEKLSK